jgi:hypothetical protein
MGVGVVIRDGMGQVLAALSQPVLAVYDPATAKAFAARRAVEFCLEVRIYDVFLEGESLSVVKAMKYSQPNWLPYGQIIDDIKGMLGSLRRHFIRHVKREANSAAHVSQKFATRIQESKVWLEEPPSCIFYMVFLEQMAL